MRHNVDSREAIPIAKSRLCRRGCVRRKSHRL